MDQRYIKLFDRFTHSRMPRRVFIQRLAKLAGGTAAAYALLPLLENNYSVASTVAEQDPRIQAKYVDIPLNGGSSRGYLVQPQSSSGTLPGVLVIHENRGLNPHIEDVTRRLALEGYQALALDFLSPLGGTPADPDQARTLIGELQDEQILSQGLAALAYLRAQGTGKVGTLGFCWGGGQVGQLAVADADLNAAVVFYGRQPQPDSVKHIQAPLLLHYAALDDRINQGIPVFEAALQAEQKRYQLHLYEGVNHAFHNDTNSARYNEEAAKLAWQRSLDFLAANLKG
ncbi:dienelactone hydrolase family protein [Balneatrix alpica]|uniref:dienelactone hydrolase family protein n=1 Tax=Balneatrix alpica TaxID=75684 RepID=UPI00273898F5|nr:dienelactone hydrolase family protein [Balneatrix alpica]